MAVNHRFGGSLGGANSTPYAPVFTAQTALGGGVITLTASQVLVGYGQSAAGGAGIFLTFPSAASMISAAGITPGAPLTLQYTMLNTDGTAANTYAAASGTNGTLDTGAATPIAGGEAGVYIIAFTSTTTAAPAYTITRIA
jgi:hypothetical protein